MVKKTKLKLVESSLQDQLDQAVTDHATAQKELQRAEAAFKVKYPDDVRFYSSGVARVDDQEYGTPEVMAKARAQKADGFRGDWEDLCQLRRSVVDCEHRIQRLQTEIAESASETEMREGLAGAIKAISAAEADLQRLSAAVGRAAENRRNADQAIASAEAALAEATEKQARLYEQAIEQGHPAGRDSSVQEARSRLDEARDELAAAKSAADGLQAKKIDAERKLVESREEIEKLVRSIATSAIPRLLEEAKAMQLELEGKRQVLSFLDDFASRDLREEVADYLAARIFPYGFGGERTEMHPAVTPWVRAVDDLRGDAAAPLPKG